MDTEQITIGKLSARPRAGTGKSQARRERTQGKIPCVIYGGGKETLPLLVDPDALTRALDPLKKRNTLIELSIEGGSTEQVMVKDYQMDVLKDRITHADFIRVSLDKPVRVRVPLELEGKSVGVKAGGALHKVFRQVEIECTPDRIPARVVGDVTDLDIGQTLTIAGLLVEEGVRVCLPATQTCALVFAPRAEGATTTAAEGEVAVEAAAAAPAEPETKGKADKGKGKDKK